MINKPEIQQALLLVFFAFLGGLTRELNDLISNKINFKNFIIGIVTAITTGLIFGKLLIGTQIPEDLTYGLTGIAGFLGPHLLYIIAKGLENKIEMYISKDTKENSKED